MPEPTSRSGMPVSAGAVRPCGEEFRTPVQYSPDVFVVGAGPGGLAFAISAALQGLRVAVADHCRPPIDKACGEGLMPDTMASLNWLGIAIKSGEGVPFRGIRFCDAKAGASVQAEFRRGVGVGIRRTVLHRKLVERANELGVKLLWGARVTFSASDRIFCNSRLVRSKYVIGADGENSQFRKWSCLEQTRYEEIRFSARQHFRLSPWSNFAEVYWGRNCQIVIAPVACDELCVAVTSREPFLRLPEALAQVPAVAHRLRCASPTNAMRGSRAALRRLSRVCRGRFALLGDASGSIDPLTGEGIGLAFKQAEALAEAIARDDLQSYQTAHDRLSRIPRLMSRLLLLMDKHPRFREAGLRILAAEPSLFSQLLNLNVGNLALSNLRFSNLLRLGWQALIPRPQL